MIFLNCVLVVGPDCLLKVRTVRCGQGRRARGACPTLEEGKGRD